MRKMREKQYIVSRISDYMGISRQAFYKRIQKEERRLELIEDLKLTVIKERKKKSRAGLRSIYYKEQLYNKIGLNSYEKMMSEIGLALPPVRLFKKTTDSRGHHYKFKNLTKGLQVNRKNQLIVGDITYYENRGRRYYIFIFRDFYTLEVKGMVGASNMEGHNAITCLQQVFTYNNKRQYNYTLILHTDAGSQYRSHLFQLKIQKAQILPSQAENCFNNGLAERTNGIVKNEYLSDYDIRSVKQLNTVLKKIKHEINEVWPSKTLGYKTPKQYAQWTENLDENQRPVKEYNNI